MQLLDPWDTPAAVLANHFPVVVAFGGGLNSTALLVKWVLDGNAPVHRILFADTGGERDETYAHVAMFSEWLVKHGMPPVETTKKGGRPETLEEYSLRTKHLPSMAYGKKGCSWKFKIEPQNRDVNRWPMARAEWKSGGKVVKLIGYGFEEQRRLAKAKLEDDKYFYRFFLNEWEMDRQGCVDVIERAGLNVPGKSSCFFCPSMKKAEITAQELTRPDLNRRAIRIEVVSNQAGNNKTSKGLGRQFAWGDFLAGADVTESTASGCMHCADDYTDMA